MVQRAHVRLAGQPAARKDGAGWPGRRRPVKPHREAAAERHRHLAVDLTQLQPRWRDDSGEARSRRLQNVSKSNGIVCWTSRSGLLTRRLSCNWRRMQPACGQKDCGLVREITRAALGLLPIDQLLAAPLRHAGADTVGRLFEVRSDQRVPRFPAAEVHPAAHRLRPVGSRPGPGGASTSGAVLETAP